MASLEQRVAAALADPELGSEPLVKLIAEVEAAAQQADAAAAKARVDALDPAVAVDVVEAGAAVVAAELRRDRLNAALPKLREANRRAWAREYEISWRESFEALEGELDVLAAELAEVYPDCVRRLVDILGKVPGLNASISHLNSHAPPGVKDRLQNVEQTARGVDGFGVNGLLSLMTELKLPKFVFEDGDRYQYAWPPPPPSMVQQLAAAGGFGMRVAHVGDWQEEIKARNRQTVAEVEAAAAKADEAAREREEKEKAEIAAAKERDRQFYREQGWPA
jgi:hypothetical protein